MSDGALTELAALVTFAFAGSASPGPNNALLWASGLRFGFARTLPHVVGTAIGVGLLVAGSAAGIGVLVDAVPAVELALKVAGSAYLLRVAYLVVGSGAMGHASASRPLGVRQAVAFQCVNPKAWVFALAAVGAFLPPTRHRVVATLALVGLVALVVAVSSTIWALGGAALGAVVEDGRRRRVVNVALAALLVASVALIWM